MLIELVKRDLKIRYRRSVLGVLWTVLNPLLTMIVMDMVFSTLFETRISNFPVYLLSANILFTFNAEATTQSIFSITGNAGLISKVYIPKYLFPLSKAVSSLVNFVFAFCALLIIIIATGAPLYGEIWAIIPLMFYLFLFTTGICFLLSSGYVFFRDIAHLYNVIIILWTYFTPIFYPIDIVPEKYLMYIQYNPILSYVNYFRSLALQGIIPGLQENMTCLFTGIISFVIGLFVFYKTQNKFILRL